MSRPPFRIEELHIRSFRGIDEFHVKLPLGDEDTGGLAIFAGDNGCGKTAILEAVLLVLGRVDLLPDDAAPIEEQVQFGAEDFSIDATVRMRDGVVMKLHVDTNVLRQGKTPGMKRLFAPVPESAVQAWGAIESLGADVQYFSARREPEALGEAVGDPHLRGAKSTREARRVVELKKRLLNTYVSALAAGTGGKLAPNSPFLRIQTFARQFLDTAGILRILPQSNNPGSDWEVVFVQDEIPLDVTSIAMARREAVKRKDIPTIVPIDRLSSGQVALFAFAGPLVFRDAPADVVLIDEPEQHMHPQWQQHILPALRELSPESQFIVATHSLAVADAALSYERFLLLREGDPRLSRNNDKVAAE